MPVGRELWHLLLVITLNKIRSKGVFSRRQAGHSPVDRRGRAGSERRRFQVGLQTYVFLKLVVREALDRLPSQYRQVVHLRMEGFEVAEIAGKLGRSKRSVERILQECREKLSQSLGDT